MTRAWLPVIGLLALLGAANRSAAIAEVDAGGVERFTYDTTQTYALKCSPSIACDIELDSGETIDDVVCGNSTKRDPQGWIVGQGTQGNTPHVYVSPTTPLGVTNLFVTTNRRKYAFWLVAVPSVSIWRYGFKPTTLEPRTGSLLSSTDPLAAPSATPTASPDRNWTVRGNAPFAPLDPYSVGDTVYLPLPRFLSGIYLHPDVVTPDGFPIPHSFDVQQNTIVVLAFYRQIVLVAGEGTKRYSTTVTYGEAGK